MNHQRDDGKPMLTRGLRASASLKLRAVDRRRRIRAGHPRRARLGLIEARAIDAAPTAAWTNIRGARASPSLKRRLEADPLPAQSRHPRRARLGLIEANGRRAERR